MKSPRNRRPRAPSSILAALGTLQLGALGLLLRGDSLPNYYIEALQDRVITEKVVDELLAAMPVSDTPVVSRV